MRARTGEGVLDSFRWYLETRYPKRLAQVTIDNYYSQAKRWSEWCTEHEFDYRTATQDDIAIYLGELRRTARPNTVRNRLIALRIFFDYAVFKDYCKENPARSLPNPRTQGRPSEEFTQQEIRRMYAACKDHRERAVFLLLLGGGLRRSEVFGITRADVNFEAGTITILGKGSKYRLVAPGPLAMGELEKALEFNDRLCPYKWNIYIEKLVKRLGLLAGVHGRVHPHRFRSHFASSYLDAGGSVEELQMILGHERVEMSLHYAKAGRNRRAVEAQARIDVASRQLSGETHALRLRETG